MKLTFTNIYVNVNMMDRRLKIDYKVNVLYFLVCSCSMYSTYDIIMLANFPSQNWSSELPGWCSLINITSKITCQFQQTQFETFLHLPCICHTTKTLGRPFHHRVRRLYNTQTHVKVITWSVGGKRRQIMKIIMYRVHTENIDPQRYIRERP